jgi:hypothetical protein
MYNPLAIIRTPLMEVLLKSPRLFVREYYERGLPECNNDNPVPLLLTCYDKENNVEQSRAFFHFTQLSKAPYSFLYDSEDPLHRSRLFVAASQPKGYHIFINMLPARWLPPPFLRIKLHAYMENNLPWWNYSKINQLHIHLKDRYGKLYVQLSWKANKAEVNLEEIENFRVCVTT